VAPPRRATARTAALPARRPLPSIAKHLPSARSLAVGVALLALAIGAYALARETSMFALRDVKVAGGSPALQAQVREALGPEVGRSLVAISAAQIEDRLADVPGVLAVRTDRDFPHTLKLVVTPERPVLLLRQGKEGWVVSARGRVLRKVTSTRVSSLPRVWVGKDAAVKVGAMLTPESGGIAATALAPLAGIAFPAHVRAVRAKESELTLVLGSGVELRLGDVGDLRLKLAVARQLLLLEGPQPDATYIDVSVPERPVVGGGHSQVQGQG
jgi:cell division septal protein FtsQ